MLNCQTAHLVITYVLLALHWEYPSRLLSPLPLSPILQLSVTWLFIHMQLTHTGTGIRTPTQNVIKSCHAGLRLSFAFAFPLFFILVSVSVACAYISITLESMHHFNETPYCHLSNSDGPTGVTNVNYFILLPQPAELVQSVRCDWADTEIWAQHVGKKKITCNSYNSQNYDQLKRMHRFITVLLPPPLNLLKHAYNCNLNMAATSTVKVWVGKLQFQLPSPKCSLGNANSNRKRKLFFNYLFSTHVCLAFLPLC